MRHEEAVTTKAAERYVLDEMTVEERDRYEDHFFGCPDCADSVKAATRFREVATRLLREKAEERSSAEPNHEGSEGTSQRGWPGWRGLFWPMPVGAVASVVAALSLAGYQTLVVVPRMSADLREARSIQPAASYFLTVSRGELPTLRVGARQRVVLLTLSRASQASHPFYEVVVRTDGGRAVSSAVIPGPPRGRELQLLLPVEGLRPGTYSLAVVGVESESASARRSEAVLYSFALQREGEESNPAT